GHAQLAQSSTVGVLDEQLHPQEGAERQGGAVQPEAAGDLGVHGDAGNEDGAEYVAEEDVLEALPERPVDAVEDLEQEKDKAVEQPHDERGTEDDGDVVHGSLAGAGLSGHEVRLPGGRGRQSAKQTSARTFSSPGSR